MLAHTTLLIKDDATACTRLGADLSGPSVRPLGRDVRESEHSEHTSRRDTEMLDWHRRCDASRG